ncbi:MAG: response regulator [Paludibacter sp.]|nr:response regulator [Paludibacter sp.]
MKIKDLKIGSQLLTGFGIILFLVISIGFTNYYQNIKIREQNQMLYVQSAQVRRAIGILTTDIHLMRLGTRDLMLASNLLEENEALQLIDESTEDALHQFDIIYNTYADSKINVDIDAAKKAFFSWNNARKINIKQETDNKIDNIKESISDSGSIGKLREDLLNKIAVIENYTKKNIDDILTESEKLKDFMLMELIFLFLVLIIITVFVYVTFLRNIRKPLVMLTHATRRFDQGDLSARYLFESKNEIGELSKSFNTLAENLQLTSDLNVKTSLIADMMLIEDDVKEFFRVTLQILMDDTQSEMAAVYLLSEDKLSYEHLISTGLAERARKSFSALHREGEFGNVITKKRIQHIKNIPEDTRFIFKTTSGNVVPKEIITIPIISGSEIIAIISLANIHAYSNQAIQLINKIHLTYSARVDKILTYEKIKSFSDSLAAKNIELEEQKRELSKQSAELTEQNRELEMQKKMLYEANNLKTIFLSNMSHELRTPLNSVIALSGVLNRKLEGKIPQEEYSYLEVIERNGRNLLVLINNILDISRIESGREEIELTEFNLCDCVSETINLISPQAVEKNIKINKAGGDCETRITSDENKINHILQNLLGNAVKFTEKGNITISIKKSIDEVSVIVTDTGIGIPADQIAHIFEEFRQADESTSRRFGGTGLGLAIAKKYANMLGGSISVDSEPNVGSTFTFTLPLYYSGEYTDPIQENDLFNIKKQIAQTSQPPNSPNESKTVLLIEDNVPAVVQLKDFLEESGYMVVATRNGEEGIETLNHIIPDAIILDLMMPGIDGFSVLEMIRKDERTTQIPVLILTAKHITKEELSFLKQNHIHQLIQKGDIKRDDLLKTVSEMVSINNTPESSISVHDKKAIQSNDKPKVLIVEDNLDNMLAAKALLSEKFIVIEASNAVDGIEFAKTYIPDLVLMDISLPGTDGIEAFKQIRSINSLKAIPVIALTASALVEDKVSILAHGFDGFLAKPIDENLLFKTINSVLYAQ